MTNWEIAKAALGLKGEKGMARCPVHNDRVNSLSVKRNGDDVVLHCFAQCDWREIRDALGLERQAPKPKAGGRHTEGPKVIVAEYEYRDLAGDVLAIKRRYHPKTFDWLAYDQGEQRWRQGLGKGGQDNLPLFNLPNAYARTRKGAALLIVEGEKDVLALDELGFAAVCNPEGASGSDKPHMWTRFVPFADGTPLVLVPDNDEPGEKHAQGMAQLLLAKGNVSILRLPNLPEKGDVSDWLQLQREAGLERDAIVLELERLIAHAAPQAPPVDPEEWAAMPPDQLDAVEERAAIMEYEAGAPRGEAEAAAFNQVQQQAKRARATLSPAERLFLAATDPETRELAQVLLA